MQQDEKNILLVSINYSEISSLCFQTFAKEMKINKKYNAFFHVAHVMG